jgi:sulfide:quinone oxidoreductase
VQASRGLELATRLSESLAGEVRATLIDQTDSFSFGFSKLDILFGRKATADVLLHYDDISLEVVEFRRERNCSALRRRSRPVRSAGEALAGSGAIPLQIGRDRIYEPYALRDG